MTKEIVYHEVNNGVATIYLNNQPANALSMDTLSELSKNIEAIVVNDDVRAVIITGQGKMFAAGADIKEFIDVFDDEDRGIDMANHAHDVFRRIEKLEKPVIAAINGACLGGGLELAMSCHLRIASEKAILGQPETNLGLIPGFGGTQRLARLVNPARALELTLFGHNIKSDEAEQMGLVNLSVSHEELMKVANEWANQLVNKSSHTTTQLLKAIYKSINGNDQDLDSLKYEATLFGKLFATVDTQEGVQAFLEKREAQFNQKEN